MGETVQGPAADVAFQDTVRLPSKGSAQVICKEFLKVLARKEVEQPIICQQLCVCAQFWRYQHYLLPLWDWGVTKIVCFGLGSFRNVKEGGGPFLDTAKKQHTYREVIRDKALLEEFNGRPVDRHDALQVMIRHVAAIEMASMLKFCSSKRGIEHQLIKHYFKKLTAIQNVPGPVAEMDEKTVKKLEKLPPTAGYAGDEELIDIPVYFCDDEYTVEDRDALNRLDGIMKMAHLPPIKVAPTQQGYDMVDEHTLVYTVDADYPVRDEVLKSKPAAMIWRDCAANPESLDVLRNENRRLLDGYQEFRLDRRRAPHTVGSSQLYIRKDIVTAAERNRIVPPYPVTFPHDYPSGHENRCLDAIERNGSGRVKRIDGQSDERSPENDA